MQHISLFSGIGGFDLASEWMGWTNVASCEINPFGRKVLEYYWPNAYHHDDIHTLTKELLIKKSNWNEKEPTILTGGFPCQPYSTAGKRLGKEDERHLWPEMLRVIRLVRPRWVVGENVHGIISWNDGMVFDEVQADLEKEGYQVWPYILPACGVNAPHRRDRVWFVAYRNAEQRKRKERGFQPKPNDGGTRKTTPNTQHDGHATAEGGRGDGSNSSGSEKGPDSTEQPKGVCQSGELGGISNASNSDSIGLQQTGCPRKRREGFKDFGIHATNSDHARLQETGPELEAAGIEQHRELGGDASNANGQRQQECNNAGVAEQKEWTYRIAAPYQGWLNFPTQPPICSRNDGFSTELDGITFSKWRNESIKAAGNAVVPQVVLQIFKTIGQFELLYLNPTNSNE